MGRGRRLRPKKLAKKLAAIRDRLGVTQEVMAERLIGLGAERTTHSGYVADFETGKREPSLPTLLAYAKLAGVSTDTLIDDKAQLPSK